MLSVGEAEGIKQMTFVGFGKHWHGDKVFNLTIGKTGTQGFNRMHWISVHIYKYCVLSDKSLI